MLLSSYYTSSIDCSFIFDILTPSELYIILPPSLNYPLSIGNIKEYFHTGNIPSKKLSHRLKEKEIIKINNTTLIVKDNTHNIDNKHIVALFIDNTANIDTLPQHIPIFTFSHIIHNNITHIKEYNQNIKDIINKIEAYINNNK